MRIAQVASVLCVIFVAALPTVAHAQELTVTCTVTAGGATAPPVEFGLAASASLGIDSLDEPLPPPAPDQVFQVYLQMTDPTVPLPNRWRREVRPFHDESASRIEVWTMTVEGGPVGGSLSLATALALGDAPPYALTLVEADGTEHEVVLGSRLDVPCTDPVTILSWILFYDEQVPDHASTWGGAKAAYNR